MSDSRWSRLIPSRRRVVAYLIVILVLLLLRVAVDVWAGYHLASVTARLAPIYQGLDLASLTPPAVGPGENRARVLAAAASLTVTQYDTLRRSTLSQALFGEPALSRLATGGDSAKRQQVFRQAVTDDRLALLVLDEAESRPKANWDITYRDGTRVRLPALREIRDLSNVNIAAGMLELGDGRADEAARRARLGLVLAGSLKQEPSLIVQLIRVAVTRDECRLLREVLAQGDPSAPALQAVADRLQDDDRDAPAVAGLIGELKYQSSLFDGLESGDQAVSPGPAVPSTLEAWLLWCLRPGVRMAHARVLEQIHQMIEYARLQPFERQARGLRWPSDEPQSWLWRSLTMLSTVGLNRVVTSGDEHRALTMLAATAVAVRRCRLDRGSYPASLDQLVPAYLPRGPVDPYTGRAPAYTPAAAGFELAVNTPATEKFMVELLDWRIAR